MRRNILYVVNEFPYPARNGVTLPSFHYLEGLGKLDAHIDLLVVPREKLVDQDQLMANKQLVDRIFSLPLQRQSIVKILYNQFLGIKPSYHSYTYEAAQLHQQLEGQSYDAIIYTPISATIVQDELKGYLKKGGITVGILSDCYTYALKTMGQLDDQLFKLSFKDQLSTKLKLIESKLQQLFEKRIVNKLDIVMCQTAVDEKAFRAIGFKHQTLVLSNGVDPSLKKMVINDAPIQKILFLGSLKGKYEYVASWLILEAWPKIHAQYPHLILKLVGKGLNSNLAETIKGDRSIEYTPFVQNLEDIYKDSQILLAPIFMKCGFINKTIEAMSAGLVVIGDETAFNGITGFKENVHGYKFNSLDDIMNHLQLLLKDPAQYTFVKQQAKALVAQDFDWDNRTNQFNSCILNRLNNENPI